MGLILTKAGLTALAEAQSSGTMVQATHLAVGDGNGTVPEHTSAATALTHEVWRGPLQNIYLKEHGDTESGKQVVFEGHIPLNAGGWYIRECAIYAGDILLAIGPHPTMWKPDPENESDRLEHTVRAVVAFSNAEAVQLIVDPTVVLASQTFVQELVAQVLQELQAHADRKDNPHEVTRGQIGAAAAVHGHTKSQITDWPTSFPPSAHNHDDRYYTESELNTKLGGKANSGHNHDTVYLGKTAKAADSAKLEGKTKAQVVAEAKGVTHKSTRSTTGTWTITGLVDGVPVILAYRPNRTSTSSQQGMKFSVTSGANDLLRPTGYPDCEFLLGAEYSSSADQASGGTAVIVPTSDTLKINISSIKSGASVAAYQ